MTMLTEAIPPAEFDFRDATPGRAIDCIRYGECLNEGRIGSPCPQGYHHWLDNTEWSETDLRRANRRARSGSFQPATEKQLDWLAALDVDWSYELIVPHEHVLEILDNLTRKEAGNLIEEFKWTSVSSQT